MSINLYTEIFDFLNYLIKGRKYMYLSRAMRESLQFTFSTKNELLITHQNQSPLPFDFLQKCMEADEEKEMPFFLLEFLDTPVLFEKEITIVNILKALEPWQEVINPLLKRKIGDYLEYFAKDNSEISQHEKWLRIEFCKGRAIKKVKKSSLSFKELIERINSGEKGLKKYQSFTGYIENSVNHYSLIYFEKDGETKSFSGDPCIEVLSYKNVPLSLAEEMETESEMFDSNSEAVVQKERQWDKKVINVAKEKAVFTLSDILKNISVLLYFESPLTQEKQQENNMRFSKDFNEMKEKFEKAEEGELSEKELMPPNRYMWKEMTIIYEELKAK